MSHVADAMTKAIAEQRALSAAAGRAAHDARPAMEEAAANLETARAMLAEAEAAYETARAEVARHETESQAAADMAEGMEELARRLRPALDPSPAESLADTVPPAEVLPFNVREASAQTRAAVARATGAHPIVPDPDTRPDAEVARHGPSVTQPYPAPRRGREVTSEEFAAAVARLNSDADTNRPDTPEAETR